MVRGVLDTVHCAVMGIKREVDRALQNHRTLHTTCANISHEQNILNFISIVVTILLQWYGEHPILCTAPSWASNEKLTGPPHTTRHLHQHFTVSHVEQETQLLPGKTDCSLMSQNQQM